MTAKEKGLYNRYMEAFESSGRFKYATYFYVMLFIYIKYEGDPPKPYYETAKRINALKLPGFVTVDEDAVRSGIKHFQEHLRKRKKAQAIKALGNTATPLYETPTSFVEKLASRIMRGIEPGTPDADTDNPKTMGKK